MTRLMAALADGDRAAFEPLFAQAWPIVRRFATRSLTDPVLGEDAAQSALLKVFERAPTFRPDGDALTWILTITAYECRTVRKARQRRREEEVGEYEDGGRSPEQEAATADTTRAVHELLASLKESDRETILTILRGEERPDVAGATFRKRVQRALGRFKSVWEAKHGHDA